MVMEPIATGAIAGVASEGIKAAAPKPEDPFKQLMLEMGAKIVKALDKLTEDDPPTLLQFLTLGERKSSWVGYHTQNLVISCSAATRVKFWVSTAGYEFNVTAGTQSIPFPLLINKGTDLMLTDVLGTGGDVRAYIFGDTF